MQNHAVHGLQPSIDCPSHWRPASIGQHGLLDTTQPAKRGATRRRRIAVLYSLDTCDVEWSDFKR